MTKEQYKREFQGYLSKYPLGKVGRLSLEEEYAKISLVSYIISRDLMLIWEDVVAIMCEIRGFTGSNIPNIVLAERQLKLRPGFIDDWNSIQYLKENNIQVMQGIENLVKSYIIELKG